LFPWAKVPDQKRDVLSKLAQGRDAQAQQFDAVLLDLHLPGAGGLDVLRRVKERRPEAVVIVVTGYGAVQSAVPAMKNGAYDYVTKPFSVDELKRLLECVATH
jgi:DNA-binding NtrC family response regulator